LRNIGFMKKALLDTPDADPRLAEELRAIESRIQEKQRTLVGDTTVRRRSEASLPSLMDRVNAQLDATGPITNTAGRDYDTAAAGFETLLEELRVLIEQDLGDLGDAMEAAGAPWTPGRGLPVWRKR
jgi:hypothetical protein